MRWRILGPVEVRGDLGPAVLRAHKQRLLLGVLLLHPNATLSVSTLIDCLWGGRPPRSARANLHSYVTQLRRLMGDDRLQRTPDGYRIQVEPDDLDAGVFERLAAEGQHALSAGDPATAVDRLGRALSLWRGEVLAGTELPSPVRPLATRLTELRLTATEDWIDASMRGDDPPDLVAELVRHAEAHPLRERFQGQLMLALHRAGRTPEALAVFRGFRDRLVEELGVEPSAALQRLHRAILAGDPELERHPAPVPEAAPAPEPSADASPDASVDPPASAGTPSGTRPVPRTLPPDVPSLVGREALLRELDALLPPGDAAPVAPLVVLVGTAGAGKTALATHWAHRVADRFPDGQLHVSLHGWSTDAPVPTLAAVTWCLRALGVPAAQIPVDLDGAVALYRTTMAERRLLLVLDNARGADQVRPLLPAGSRCLTVVTSRDRLTGLVAVNHARRLTVEPLSHDDAVALLRGALGRAGDTGTPADADALAELADACGRLPLALRIAAAKCADYPGDDLAPYVAALTGASDDLEAGDGLGDGLGALDVGDDPQASVRAAFALSYRQLPAPHRALFRRLGLAPGGDVTLATATALVGPDAAGTDVASALDDLAAAHLVERHGARYALHDLLRAYARDEARRADPPPVRAAAFERLCRDYEASVEGAARMLYAHMLRLPAAPGALEPRAFADGDEARDWLDAELPNLVAVIRHAARHGPAAAAWRLADGLRGYFWLRRLMADWLAATEAGRAAAEAAGDPAAIAAMRLSLGQAARCIGLVETADAHLAVALPASDEAGWPEAQASILGHQAIAHAERGDNLRALDLLQKVLGLNRALNRLSSVAVTLGNLGTLRYQMGYLHRSRDDSAAARRLYRETGNAVGAALTTCNLGITTVYLGAHDEARELLLDGLRASDAVGDPVGQALAHYGLAKLHSETGDPAGAATHAAAATGIAHRAGDVGTYGVCATELALARYACGHQDDVVEACLAVRAETRGADTAYSQVWTLIGLARAYRLTGDLQPALSTAREALVLARCGNYRLLAGEARRVLAEVHLDLREPAAAAAVAVPAVAALRASGYVLGERHARSLLARARTHVGV